MDSVVDYINQAKKQLMICIQIFLILVEKKC